MRPLRQSLRAVTRELLDVLFPASCVGCGRYGVRGEPEAAQWFCFSCRQRVLPPPVTCVACSTRTHAGVTCASCQPSCPLGGVIAVGRYADPALRAAITHLKFHGVRALAPALGDLLARRLVAAGVPATTRPSAQSHADGPASQTILVPLPLHLRRERSRGFNQARLIADAVSDHLDLPVRELLVRRRNTAPQTTILESPRARRENVTGVFTLTESRVPAGTGRVILVDDVLTTGATALEAARVLAQAGVRDLWAGVIARG